MRENDDDDYNIIGQLSKTIRSRLKLKVVFESHFLIYSSMIWILGSLEPGFSLKLLGLLEKGSSKKREVFFARVSIIKKVCFTPLRI